MRGECGFGESLVSIGELAERLAESAMPLEEVDRVYDCVETSIRAESEASGAPVLGPLNATQRAYLMARADSETSTHIYYEYSGGPDLDAETFASRFHHLVCVHDMLRATLVLDENQTPVGQAIHPVSSLASSPYQPLICVEDAGVCL